VPQKITAQLPHLCRIEFGLANLSAATRAALLSAAAEGHFACVQDASLNFAQLSADELSALLAGMPQLSRLFLLRWPDLHSLRWLASPQLVTSLRDLAVFRCSALPVSELTHVYGLTGLHTLVLTDSFEAPLSAHSQRLLAPGSKLLPHLKVFVYEPPKQSR